MSSTVLSQERKNAQPTTYPVVAQVMMTLAQLAATAPNERPSGETLEQHQTRILNGINSQLSNSNLVTNAEWQAVWVGLTQDGANLAYIAQNTSQNAFAVCLRGTQFNSLIDLMEDLEVSSVVEFTAGPSYSQPLLVSQGAMQAFTEVINAYYIPDRSNLLQALTILLENASANPTLYITGHSLGGAMATMVALYLYAQSWTNAPTFGVYTFAAPTAGLQAFADCFDGVFGSVSQRYYNDWDVVPNAWVETSMSTMQETFYPSIVSNQGPGPAQNVGVNQLIGQFMKMPGENAYFQTNQNDTSISLNQDYSAQGTTTYGPGSYNTNFVNPTTADFLGQAGFQHNNYLAFLGLQGSQLIPSLVPTISNVAPVSPNTGPSTGDTQVTIEGSNFTSDCMVDFGTMPALGVTFVSQSQLKAISPPGAGTVDVRVTNNFGTSAVTLLDQFTSPPPALAPAVSTVTPSIGPAENGYAVTITGTGFTSDCSVFFGETPAAPDQTIIMSLTEISVPPPTSGSGTVAVTVTTTGSPGSSNTPTFTFGPPVVTEVNPSFAVLGKNYPTPSVKIGGVGFGTSQGNGTVAFINQNNQQSTAPQSYTSWSDTEIQVVPPIVDGIKNTVFDVVVTNSDGLGSTTTTADEMTYYYAGQYGIQS